jgi:FixJ family two-component response regulator
VTAERVIGIVDDDQSLRTALVRLVRSLGYDARGFASAEEFIDSDAVVGCSCIVTDIQMPGMSGIDLIQAIAKRRSTIPVIVITARPDPGLKDSALASGAIQFLRKPLDPDAFAESLEAVLKA